MRDLGLWCRREGEKEQGKYQVWEMSERCGGRAQSYEGKGVSGSAPLV